LSSKFPRYKRPPSGSPCLNKSRVIRGFALTKRNRVWRLARSKCQGNWTSHH
jgi:hypothetical protein